mgnify:CR=1 FL=1
MARQHVRRRLSLHMCGTCGEYRILSYRRVGWGQLMVLWCLWLWLCFRGGPRVSWSCACACSFGPLFSDPTRRLDIQARFCLLLTFNHKVTDLLPFVDLSLRRPGMMVADASELVHSSMLGHRVSRVRELIFTRTKLEYWNATLKATEKKTPPAEDECVLCVCVCVCRGG